MPRRFYLLELTAFVSLVLLPALLLSWFTTALSSPWGAISADGTIRLNNNDEIKIAIFADLHYGEEEHGWGIDQDIKSMRVMRSILDFEYPDFVIFSLPSHSHALLIGIEELTSVDGDLITGENTFLHNSTKYVDLIVESLVQRNVPWASTYGNHDSQYNLSREALFVEESKYSLSYTQHSPPGVAAVTNYYLPIYPAKTHEPDLKTPVAILWFFDSQGGAPFQGPAYSEHIPNWVEPSIVTWFNAEQENVRSKWGDIPSLAFVHIPSTAFLEVQNTLFPEGQESAHFPGLNADFPLAAQGDGTKDIPFIQALVNAPGLHSLYSGHDHGDAWCGNWPEWTDVTGVSKPHVCFCKHTGYGGYGTWNRGSRMLKLRFGKGGMDVDTWVRMENGKVVQSVSLNSTYGEDVYSTDNGENP